MYHVKSIAATFWPFLINAAFRFAEMEANVTIYNFFDRIH